MRDLFAFGALVVASAILVQACDDGGQSTPMLGATGGSANSTVPGQGGTAPDTQTTGGTTNFAPAPTGMTGSGTITDPYGSQVVTRGSQQYVVQNNRWGGNGQQTITFNGTTFTVTAQTGDNSAADSPVSYPSVFIGSNNGRSSGGPLPKAVSSLGVVQTSWTNNAGTPSGTYNAAYDVWFSTTSAGDAQGPSGGYLMVWFYKPAKKSPIGSDRAPSQSISGKLWDVWYGTNGNIPCVSYVAVTPLTSWTFDLNVFIKDAVQRGYVQSSWYLTNVFAGFEIWSGGVGLQSTDFYVIVN